MRTLQAAPPTFVDPTSGAPAFGSYAGPLPRVELGDLALLDRLARRKKWIYVAIASDDVWISLAVVRMGYATSAFGFVLDRVAGRMLADHTVVGPPRAAEITSEVHASGVLARFGFRGSTVSVTRRAGVCDVRARLGDLDLDVELDATTAPPAVSAIALLGPNLTSATEKRALAVVRGSVTIGQRRIALDRALGGYDYTHGLMPRHTRWRWAFAMGQAKDGRPVAFNVVDGFVGEAECASFHEHAVHPLREPRIAYPADQPEGAWTLRADGIDLTFDPVAAHVQNTNLLLVRSRFLQPVGTFRGLVRIGDRDVELDGIPGVVEDQDVLW